MAKRSESRMRQASWLIALPFLALAALALPAEATAQDAAPTFTEDVAPVLQENCVRCHSEGAIGPMSLRTYDETRPWGQMIQTLTEQRKMPPYHIDTDVGIQDIKDDWRLSDQEIQTIASWVGAGMPEGPAEAMPAQRQFEAYDHWQLADEIGREPDLVIESKPFDVPAEGSDIWWRPVVDIPIDRDRRVRAIETRPSYPSGVQVVHHANPRLLIQNEEGEWDFVAQYSEYAMGKVGELIPEDAYRILPHDGLIQWDIHYWPGGSSQLRGETVAAEDDVVRLAFWFYDEGEAPEFEQELSLFPLQGDIALPPNGTAMTQGFVRWDHPVRLDSFQPHGHQHLHAMSARAVYPDGSEELLSMTTNFDARWHHSYLYEDDAAPLLPTGTVLVLTGWYDNTIGNPLATDPEGWVTRGSRTHDEMSHAWISLTHLDEEGYQRIKAEREQEPLAAEEEE